MKDLRVGIWARLLIAFGAIAGITLLVGVMALLIFEHSSSLVKSITERYIPEIVQVVEFAEIGGEIIAVAPRLLATGDDNARMTIQSDIDKLLVRLNRQIKLMDNATTDFRAEVAKLAGKLKKNLIDLQQMVARRLELQKQLNKMTEGLRWLYADLISEIDPLNQDYAYNLDAELEKLIDAVKRRDQTLSPARLQANRHFKETIEKIRSNGVLLVSLMAQASTSSSLGQINSLAALSNDAIAFLRIDINELSADASLFTLKQVFLEIFLLAEGNQSVFSIKTDIIEGAIKEQATLRKNSVYVNRLRRLIDEIVSKTQEETLEAVTRARKTLERARLLLLAMVSLSLAIAISVLWFYVRGSIVARLAALSRSMGAIAAGDLSYEVPKAGRDEIGQMAVALRVFKDTALNVEEANAQAIIDNAAVGLVIANLDGAIHFFNPMAAALFLTDSEIMVGRSLYSIVVEENRTAFANACDSVLETDMESYVLYTFTGLRSDGSTFPIDLSIRKVHQRKQTSLMITVHDVTEREHAQQLLRKRVREKTEHLSRINLKLRQEIKKRHKTQNVLVQAGKLSALGQLAAGIAHEMNQPLSAIRYYLHNARKLLERGRIEVHEENLQKMGELIERMAKMISHLKTFARWQGDHFALVDVVPVMEQALALVMAKLEKTGVHLVKKYPETPITVKGDAIRLEQVFVNIIGNAIDAVSENPANERDVIIKINASHENVIIGVLDNGPGIDSNNYDAIFDPFFTTKEVGQGLGLGLSISYNIIKGFDGTIVAGKEKGGWTHFFISLPKVIRVAHDSNW
ncbi:MAG: PAS domain S-box protein [Deltaproteobacteria bacterium]|nr:PAS domain S-box protein [Deltaproteobacteria bacterium]